MENRNNFKFFIPAEISKATSESGEEIMKIKGIASTPNKDSQDEFLDPSGMDLSAFQWINWNHKGKDDPSDIIGEPTLAQVNGQNQLYIEGILYPDVQKAKATWALMKALSKSRSGNKLGLSVEGKVLERDANDPKKITKSKIVGVAICPVPINGDTWVDFLQKGYTKDENELRYDDDTVEEMEKGGVGSGRKKVTVHKYGKSGKYHGSEEHDTDFAKKLVQKPSKNDVYHYSFIGPKKESDEDTEKAITIADNPDITKESVEHGEKRTKKPIEAAKKLFTLEKEVKNLTKSEIYEQIFVKFNTEYEIAKSVYNIITQITAMSNKTEITQEDINKALQLLEIAKASTATEVSTEVKEEISKADVENKEKVEEPKAEEVKEEEKEVEKSSHENEEDELDNEMVEKAMEFAKKLKAEGCDKETMMKSLTKKGYGEAVIKKAVDSVAEASENKDGGNVEVMKKVEEMAKSLSDMDITVKAIIEESNKKFDAVANLYKATTEDNNTLKKSLEDSLNLSKELKSKLDKYESTPNTKKSILNKSFTEKFEKSADGKTVYNVTNKADRKKLADVLEDLSGINKSENFDMELMKAAQDIELGGNLTPRVINRLNAANITVVAQ